jgi:hypothetical protein
MTSERWRIAAMALGFLALTGFFGALAAGYFWLQVTSYVALFAALLAGELYRAAVRRS